MTHPLSDREVSLENLDRQIDILTSQQTELSNQRVELNLKSEKLAQREEALKEAELSAQSTQAELSIVEEQLKARQAIVDSLETKIDRLDKDYTTQKNKYQSELEILISLITQKNKTIDKLNESRIDIEQTSHLLNEELEIIKDNIKQGKLSFANQEKDFKKTRDDWTKHLTTFQQEIDNMFVTKDTCESDIEVLEQSKTDLSREIEDVKSRLETLQNTYISKEAKLQEKIGDTVDFLNQRKAESSEIEQIDKARAKALNIREKSLNIREESLNERQFELEQREKRISSKMGLLSIE